MQVDGRDLVVGPGVAYDGGVETRREAGPKWATTIARLLGSPQLIPDASVVVVAGNAPHAVYAWIGMEAGQRCTLVARRMGHADLVAEQEYPFGEPLDVVTKVVPGEVTASHSRAELLFIGMPDHVVDGSLPGVRKACDSLGLRLDLVTTITMPERNVSSENYGPLLGQLASTIRRELSMTARSVGSDHAPVTLLVLMSVPTAVAMGVGKMFRPHVLPDHVRVRFVEKLKDGDYHVY